MTTIVGVQGDGFAVICADSRVSMFDDSGGVFMSLTVASHHSKLCKKGKYLIGVAGDMRAINIIQHVFTPPTPAVDLRGEKLDTFITAKFIPALRDCFEQQGYSTNGDKDARTQPIQHGAQLVVSVHSTIFQIDNDYAWCSDSRGMYGAGTGAPYALGAMQALSRTVNTTGNEGLARSVCVEALRIASLYDPYTGPPYAVGIQERSGRTTVSLPDALEGI